MTAARSTRWPRPRTSSFNLRFQHATGQLDNTSRGCSDVRREIARINTMLRQREIAAAEAVERGQRDG